MGITGVLWRCQMPSLNIQRYYRYALALDNVHYACLAERVLALRRRLMGLMTTADILFESESFVVYRVPQLADQSALQSR